MTPESTPMTITSILSRALLAAAVLGSGQAYAASHLKQVSFGTNWRAQAEHGGFYQALADGTYEACGLDVDIVQGGPQVNNRALMLAGKIDFYMGGDLLLAFAAVEQDIPLKVVAAMFQKHPQAILAHPGKAETFEDLKDLTVLVADGGFNSYYQWMISEYGFSADQREPYTFNPAPFVADEGKAMQAYVSSEPFAIQKEAGWTPEVFLIADAGYATYATTIETMTETIEGDPDAVTCFVEGSIKGWYNYLYGDPSAGNALIKQANPDMSDDKIAFAIDTMKERGIVDSGDAETLGIGVVTLEKVQAFHDQMVEAGVIESIEDLSQAFDASFVGKGVGMDLKP